jgi:hypothetical protein
MSPSIAGWVCFEDECFCGEEAEELQVCIENLEEIGDNDQSIDTVFKICKLALDLVGCEKDVRVINGKDAGGMINGGDVSGMIYGGDASASAMTGTGVALGITCALCVLNAIGGGGKPWRRDAREKKA